MVMAVLDLMGVSMVAAQGGFGDPESAGYLVGTVIGHILFLSVNGIVLAGAIQMMKLRSYGFAMTASILAVIPCCSPCFILGIPFGIWGIVVLSNAQVKHAFR